ncbi:unnamed protein product [Rotaria magnacalcarata]|uniref:RUN domain-containing protein n=2 Tax=Rotaria magnacalcarata TaxID=392030 RepID=A0A819CNT2_9BILA|nr:unnamed protein product [Rotaria magnacalcarata]CAF2126094.1 unnamed protein product [Rotaria magnacalcarata]CAF3815554.1 unnamed protein product [Rotaria magnacalcarata]CAF3852428.1 unnamed protein product [Rotaria magnacalcarata]
MSYPSEQTTYYAKSLMTGRLTPIGGASSDTDYDGKFSDDFSEKQGLLEDHEKLNASLSALTCHFAHVQLRLQQVISAPTPEDRENLLLELHKFASSGIPDVMCQSSIYTNDFAHEQLIEAEKCREKIFINELKRKLDELERYALASGSLEGAPTSVMVEKQRILIDELREKLDLQLDDEAVSKLSAEELRQLVDQGIHQITNPMKIKEKLINQMRTEISDLEKFIDFLKTDSAKSATNTTITFSPSSASETSGLTSTATTHTSNTAHSADSYSSWFPIGHNSLNIFQTIKRILILTQLYTFFFLTCGKRSVYKTFDQTTGTKQRDIISKHHFGGLRAQLEIAISKVLHIIRSNNLTLKYLYDDDTSGSDTDEYEKVYSSSAATLSSIRQDLVPALRGLLEHGLNETSYSTSVCLWGCFSTRSTNNQAEKNDTMHIWELFLKYFDMKHGNEFVNSPARKLSQSFALDIVGGRPVTLTQYLLSGIDTIVKMHSKHPQHMDRCFKSFVCYALNERKLVPFLRLILQSPTLVEHYYQPWSYTKKTGFNDALHSLDRLTSIDFRLPIDTSVRRFINHRDIIE